MLIIILYKQISLTWWVLTSINNDYTGQRKMFLLSNIGSWDSSALSIVLLGK